MHRSLDDIMGVLEEHREAIGRYGVRRLAIFGSQVRGDAHAGSDLDFIVEFDKKSFDAYMELKFFLEELFDVSVDLVISDTLKPRLRDKILKETIDVPGL